MAQLGYFALLALLCISAAQRGGENDIESETNGISDLAKTEILKYQQCEYW